MVILGTSVDRTGIFWHTFTNSILFQTAKAKSVNFSHLPSWFDITFLTIVALYWIQVVHSEKLGPFVVLAIRPLCSCTSNFNLGNSSERRPNLQIAVFSNWYSELVANTTPTTIVTTQTALFITTLIVNCAISLHRSRLSLTDFLPN
jgi:hypothetical protein